MATKKKSNRLLRNLIGIIALLIVGVLFARWMGWINPEKPLEVLTAKVKKVDIVEKVTASGKIQPETQVKISPDVSGEIVEVMVKEGDSVIQGQLLLKIRPDNIQTLVQNAEANLNSRRANLSQSEAEFLQRKAELDRTKADYDRSKQLYEQKVVSVADYQLAQMNYEVAKQRVESSKRTIDASRYNVQSALANLNQNLDNLSRTNIYAPANGTISKLSVEKGEKVVGTAQMAGTEMLIIANLNTMEVEVDVNENDIVKLKTGQRAIVEVDSYNYLNKKFDGVVTEIANTANPTTTADAVTEFKVKIRILNDSYKDLVNKSSRLSPFRPGMNASVEIITEKRSSVLSVPLAAVTTRNPDDEKKTQIKQTSNTQNQDQDKQKKVEQVKEIVFVFDEKNKKVKMKEVKTGISDFDNIEILSGLKDGDEIVTGPYIVLSKQLNEEALVKKSEKKEGKRDKN